MRTPSEINRDATWTEDGIPLDRHSGYVKIADIMKHMPPGRVLEVGCASGRFLERLSLQGWDVVGLELQPQAKRFIVTADVSRSWPLDDRFDVIIAAEVIEHVVDTDGFLDECASHLVPGGTLILTTPNLLFWVNRVRMLFGHRPCFAYAPWHVRMFVWSDLRDRIERRFRIRRLRGTHVLVGIRHTRLFVVFAWLADLFPTLAAHFIVVARLRVESRREAQ